MAVLENPTGKTSSRRMRIERRAAIKSAENRHSGLSQRWWSLRWVACVFLTALTAAAYNAVRYCPLNDYDDEGYISSNQHVLSGLSWETLKWSFTSTAQSNWHPLTWLSHALDCQLFGTNAGAHHLTNLAFHLVNVVLLFLLLEAATGYRGRSFVVAALFALHPFNVDSVAWVAERKNLLSTFFFFLSLGAYGWYARRPVWRRYAVVCLLFVLGLLTKPMLVTFPFVLMLVDYWPLNRIEGWTPISGQFPVPQISPKRLLVEKLPLFFISAASSVVTMLAQRGSIQPLYLLPLDSRLENAVASYFLYLWKTFWPSDFAILYPNPFEPAPGQSVAAYAWAGLAAGAFLLLAVTALAWRQRHIRPYLLVGWLWYLGTLVPVIGIVQVGVQGMADRYTYVPLIGIFLITTWRAADAASRRRVKPAWKITVAALVLAALSFMTLRQVGYWRSNLTLWQHTLQVTSGNVTAYNHVGTVLTKEGREEEAIPYFQEAARLDPRDTDSRLVLGAYAQDNGRLKDALQNYQVVVHGASDPQQVILAYVNVSVIFGEMGDFPRAREAYERAVLKSPEITQAKLNELDAMVAADPTDEGFLRLGLLAGEAGMIMEARTAFYRALQLNPGRAEVQRALDHLNSMPTQ